MQQRLQDGFEPQTLTSVTCMRNVLLPGELFISCITSHVLVIKTFTKWANVLRFDYQNVVFSKADE